MGASQPQPRLQGQGEPSSEGGHAHKIKSAGDKAKDAIQFSLQAQKLSLDPPQQAGDGDGEESSEQPATSLQHPSSVATKAHFVTPQDPVIVTADGNRLPGVPLQEAHKLNLLRDELEGQPQTVEIKEGSDGRKTVQAGRDAGGHEGDGEGSSDDDGGNHVIELPKDQKGHDIQKNKNKNENEGRTDDTLRQVMPPSHTNPLFPPLPLYGPSSLLRDLQCTFFRVSSFFLSTAFLGVIVLGALFTSVPLWYRKLAYKLRGRNVDEERPFYGEEVRRAKARDDEAKAWKQHAYGHKHKHRKQKQQHTPGEAKHDDLEDDVEASDGYTPTEGGPDPIKCDPGYYARRVGLDVETCQVQTEDGFVIELWHVYDPREYTPLTPEERRHGGPDIFQSSSRHRLRPQGDGDEGDGDGDGKEGKRKPRFPVLLMHGLLQSAGAYCCNDDASLAFWLCKSGYDVWLGNNRCGFRPRHVLLDYADPRMWCWNIRQMGVFDLPALASRVLAETGLPKLGLVAHSQGTTQTFVALAREQRPELGAKLTVFCALAPAVYAGPLIGKMYFKFMRVISPAAFRLMFGIHAFIPLMMRMHALLDPRLYGWLGYKVFSFLFDWTDARWDRGLRDRMFQFAPVYVSAESMRWWLGRECFANHKCILATREAVREEDRVDREHDEEVKRAKTRHGKHDKLKHDKAKHGWGKHQDAGDDGGSSSDSSSGGDGQGRPSGSSAWYDEQAPPFAFWICGNDDLVDGRRLQRRFDRGREPHVRVVHSKVIPEYEHLDVIWAMDAPDQVFKEVREVLWRTCEFRDLCRVPTGCEHV